MPSPDLDEATVLQAALDLFGDMATTDGRASALIALDEAERARDEAIERVTDNAEPEWMDAARWAVFDLAQLRDELTADAVWALLERRGVPPPHEPKAMGGLMKWCQGAGYIEPTDRFVKSSRAVHHAGPIRVWRSKLKGVRVGAAA